MQRRASKPRIFVLCLLIALGAAGLAAAGGGDEARVEKRIVLRGHHGGAQSGTFLGVQLSELTRELRIHFGVPETVGVMVSKVLPDTPAERAGVQVGDIITRVDGEDVVSANALAHAIRQRAEGDVVDLEVWREKRIETLSPTLAKRKGLELDCGADCEVKVICDGGDCECTVNGEAADCEELPMHEHHRILHERHHDGE